MSGARAQLRWGLLNRGTWVEGYLERCRDGEMQECWDGGMQGCRAQDHQMWGGNDTPSPHGVT